MIRKEYFGKMTDGKEVERYILSNAGGMEVEILPIGAAIRSIRVPRRDGSLQEAVLSYETAPEYEVNHGCLGACIGPHGNRIADACFELNGETYRLEANNGVNNLHSGSGNAGKKLWQAEIRGEELVLQISLPDGEAGFPGNRELCVVYRLTDENLLEISYRGTTDRDTILNMTNHSYFNLGEGEEPVFSTLLQIDADSVTEVREGLIPTGRLLPVEGTPFDFRKEKPIGQDIREENEQLAMGQGYDHNYVLNGTGWRLAAKAMEPSTGLCMEVYTDQTAVQFYTANTLGAPHAPFTGFCLETQHNPDSIHHPEFPPVVTRAGETYATRTGYRFFRV